MFAAVIGIEQKPRLGRTDLGICDDVHRVLCSGLDRVVAAESETSLWIWEANHRQPFASALDGLIGMNRPGCPAIRCPVQMRSVVVVMPGNEPAD